MLHALIAAAALALTGPPVGAAAPDFQLTTVYGKHVALADYRGKTLIVNVWATWCPPCRNETAALVAASRRLGADGTVAFLGVDVTETAPIVRAFVAAKDVPYDQAIDAGETFARAYDVHAFPTTLVIGPDGVLRARYVDEVDAATLEGFVADARAGRNSVVTSIAQRKIDALLAPANFVFGGNAASVRAAGKAALAAIAAAEQIDGNVDFPRTKAEESALADAAASALAAVAGGGEDTAMLALLEGDSALASEHWDDAAAAYKRGLQVAPRDTDLLGGLETAYRELHEDASAAEVQSLVAEIAPSVEAFIELGDVAGRAGRYHDGAVAFARAIGLARAEAAAKPHDAKAQRRVAVAYLYEGRMYARKGDAARARKAFAQTTAWAQRLPKTDTRYAMYLEEAQEATVALAGAPGAPRAALSLAPWTGADLPGSIASTFKYRLVVTGLPGTTLVLSASGLPTRWIASFCSDLVCAPFRTTLALPNSGVKVVEFQVIPFTVVRSEPNVRIEMRGAGKALASVQTVVR
jgi:peroxiredoxin